MAALSLRDPPPPPASVSEESSSLIDLITKQTAAEGCPRHGVARRSSARLPRPMRRRVSPRCRTVPGEGGSAARGCSSDRGSAAGGRPPSSPRLPVRSAAPERRESPRRGCRERNGAQRPGGGGGGTLSACGRQLRPAGSGRGLTHTRLCVAGRSGPARSPGVGGSRGEDMGRPGVQCRLRPRGDGRATGGNGRTAASLGRDPPPHGPDPGPDPRPEGSVGRGGREAKAGRSRAHGL